jgi:hypothetical protein
MSIVVFMAAIAENNTSAARCSRRRRHAIRNQFLSQLGREGTLQ